MVKKACSNKNICLKKRIINVEKPGENIKKVVAVIKIGENVKKGVALIKTGNETKNKM